MGYTPPYLDVRKVAGGWTATAPSTTTGDDLTIKANSTDVTPSINLRGAADIYFTSTGLYLFDGAAQVAVIYKNGDNLKILTSQTNGDIELICNGTGKVKFGTYTAGAAADSAGYITIKDAAGNTRKLMVQA